ncbi:MAG: ATP-binding protein [Pseudomonadota bacterium]
MFFEYSRSSRIEDVLRLVQDVMPESRTLELKCTLSLEKTDQKKEFLADVSALANTLGGSVVFGIEEAEGFASKIIGLTEIDKEKQTLRMEQLLRDGLQPSLSGCKFEWLTTETNKEILVLKVRRSRLSPHRVTLGGSSRFYRRGERGKYELDVYELRDAFFETEQENRRAQDFHLERSGMLLAGEAPVLLQDGPKFLSHLISDAALLPRANHLDLEKLPTLPPPGAGGWNKMSCLEGVLGYTGAEYGDEKRDAYTLVYSNGIVESVALIGSRFDEGLILSLDYFDRYAHEILRRQLNALIGSGWTYPFSFHFTVIDVRDAKLYDSSSVVVRQSPIGLRRDILTFGAVRIDHSNTDMQLIHSNFLIQVSQAFGLAQT